jgi:hypothetical protein
MSGNWSTPLYSYFCLCISTTIAANIRRCNLVQTILTSRDVFSKCVSWSRPISHRRPSQRRPVRSPLPMHQGDIQLCNSSDSVSVPMEPSYHQPWTAATYSVDRSCECASSALELTARAPCSSSACRRPMCHYSN